MAVDEGLVRDIEWQQTVAEGICEFVEREPGASLAALAAALEGLTNGSRDGGFLIVPITHCALGMHGLRQEADPEIRARGLAAERCTGGTEGGPPAGDHARARQGAAGGRAGRLNVISRTPGAVHV